MEEPTANKRQEIKDRIAAAQERQSAREGSLLKTIGDKAAVARDEVAGFAKQHPVATVAGGLALGIVISALFKTSPTRRAGRYAGERAAGLAAVGSEAAAALLAHVLEGTATARKAGAEKLEDAGTAARDSARHMGKAIARSFTRG
jgi:hypothetical protein